jgi:hypothetical protein
MRAPCVRAAAALAEHRGVELVLAEHLSVAPRSILRHAQHPGAAEPTMLRKAAHDQPIFV